MPLTGRVAQLVNVCDSDRRRKWPQCFCTKRLRSRIELFFRGPNAGGILLYSTLLTYVRLDTSWSPWLQCKSRTELTTLGAFLPTMRRIAVNQISSKNMTREYRNFGVPTRIIQWMAHQWFATSILRVSRWTYCNPNLVLLTISGLAKVDCNFTGEDWFSFKRSTFNFILFTSESTRKRADGTQAT